MILTTSCKNPMSGKAVVEKLGQFDHVDRTFAYSEDFTLCYSEGVSFVFESCGAWVKDMLYRIYEDFQNEYAFMVEFLVDDDGVGEFLVWGEESILLTTYRVTETNFPVSGICFVFAYEEDGLQRIIQLDTEYMF